MSKDPFLSAHGIGNKCFEVGGEFSPASIRDQMVRAYLLVHRAFEGRLIGASGPNLLVVGAGPSGLTAALHAARLGVAVTIAEKQPRHALLLGRCKTRDVEPTLYDWPVDHWGEDVFDWTGARMPLRWRSGRANLIALAWQRRLSAIVAAHPGLITLSYNTFVNTTTNPPRAVPGGVNVELGPYGAGTNHLFGAVISCIGFGEENCSVGAYRGPAFWESDDLEKPNCGFAGPPKILISGGGDGALQDFIRALTSRSTKAAFNGVLQAFARFPWVFDSIQSEIQSAEDIAARALSWNLAQHDDAIFRRLEDAHMAVIHRLRTSHAWRAVATAVRSMVPAQVPQIDLIHRKPHFTQCYAVNRFLSLLILDVLGHTSVVRKPATNVVAVNGMHPHVCTGVAGACKGHAHAVTLETGGVPSTVTYDLVILRHGILGPRHLLPGRRTANLRQLLPYYVDV